LPEGAVLERPVVCYSLILTCHFKIGWICFLNLL
jgi:hypothetical protein